jgi:hypothetical protein
MILKVNFYSFYKNKDSLIQNLFVYYSYIFINDSDCSIIYFKLFRIHNNNF